MNEPGQLNIQCTLGALNLSKQGSLSSIFARYRMPQKDRNSTFSANYESKVAQEYSKNFATLTRGSGGTIPRLNLSIGAPMATFIEGSIIPNAEHPVYNLVKGAVKSNFSNSSYYLPPGNEITQNPGSGLTRPSVQNFLFAHLNQGASGYIPVKRGEIPSEVTSKYTWNIWKQLTNNDLNKKIIPGLGVVNYEKLGATHVETSFGSAYPTISVNAANTVSALERIFPISDDLLYNAPNIYFGKSNTNQNIKEVVQAKGGVNCGFWLRFQNITNFSYYNPGNGFITKSSLRIAFGNFNRIYPNKISQFSIIINEGSTILRYNNPVSQNNEFVSIQLNNGAQINDGTIDVFVHFAGPNMYVGFSEDVSLWNVFEPQTLSTDDSKIYEPFIDQEARILVLVENFNCSFSYSPICFDSYDPELVSDLNPAGKASINVRFNVNSNDAVAVASCNPELLNKNLASKSNPFSIQQILDKISDGPTYYCDWRRVNYGDINSSRLTLNAYLTNPELKYNQLSTSSSLARAEDPRTFFTGIIKYETTIEGPIFFYARNFKEEEVLTKPGKMVKEIWKNYSDISKYFESAKITETYKNKNLSYKEVKADITLVNMTNDNIGRQILNAIQENILVITLKSGYDDDEKHIFFQGVINTVKVNRSSDSFTVSLSCIDLGDYLLDNMRFPFLSYFLFGTRTYQYLLQDIFEAVGLTEYYRPRPRSAGFDVIYDYYFLRYQGEPLYQTSLNNRITQVNVQNRAKQPLLEILQHLIYTKDDSGYFNEFLPVFRWDSNEEIYTLGLRGDEEPEELWLAGDTSDEQLLANANKSIHGIVQGGPSGWSETTELDNLHSEVWLEAIRYDNLPIFAVSNPAFRNRAVSNDSFDRLNNLVTEDTNLEQANLGYVGFNKILYANEKQNALVKTPLLAKKVFDSYQHISRFTYQELELQVYVTKPLKSHYRFTVKSFNDSGFIDFSGEYNYNYVEYDISANQNIIKAKIVGSYFPKII